MASIVSDAAADELVALEAIFGADFRRHDTGCEVDVAHGAAKATLVVTFGAAYPDREPPQLSVATVSGLSERQRLALVRVAESTARSEVCVYDVATALGAALEDIADDEEDASWTTSEQPRVFVDESRFAVAVIEGETIVDRKSTFKAFLAFVTCEGQKLWVLRSLLSRPRLAKATHNMVAYRYVDRGTGALHADNDDDGEAGAGVKMALILDLFQATNVLVMVSRWYGGTKLGAVSKSNRALCTEQVMFVYLHVLANQSN
mmetsp:Transcript_1484/g.4385  ORF Transcript_1484/g.4385 Transcript_1484/m.4385 type:complete len:261 (+) Transcript_1484:758-1540(+)